MEDERAKPPSISLTAVEQRVERSRTLRLKLAASLRLQAERVAHSQGVSVGYWITKAIEEKIARRRTLNLVEEKGDKGVHLVPRRLSNEGT